MKHQSEDKRINDDQVLASILHLFASLLKNDAQNQSEKLHLLPSAYHHMNDINHNAERQDLKVPPTDVMLRELGFSVEKRSSSLTSGGTGVFVTQGRVPKGVTVAMYPGT